MRYMELFVFTASVFFASMIMGVFSGWGYSFTPPGLDIESLKLEYTPSQTGPWGDYTWGVKVLTQLFQYPFTLIPNLVAAAGLPEPWPKIFLGMVTLLFALGILYLVTRVAGW